MAWWRPECPVRPVEQEWIEESLDWFLAEFGRDVLLGDVVLPTDDYFPGVYEGGREDVTAVFGRVCGHMGIDPVRVDLTIEDGDDDEHGLSAEVGIASRSDGAAGLHQVRRGRSVVSIRADQARRPMALVATIAHELGHVLLLGEGRVTSDREDHEPLTDLLTVYFGLGIFGANAALEYGQETRGRHTYSHTSRLGYLTEPMYGYGLARYAWLRGETDPTWAGFVDPNPRAFLKRGLRYLRQNASGDTPGGRGT